MLRNTPRKDADVVRFAGVSNYCFRSPNSLNHETAKYREETDGDQLEIVRGVEPRTPPHHTECGICQPNPSHYGAKQKERVTNHWCPKQCIHGHVLICMNP